MGTAAGQQPPSGGSAGTDSQRANADPAGKGQQGGSGTGGQPAGQGQQGNAGVGEQFNREELDPAIRGMGPKQLNELFMGLLQQAGRNGGRNDEPAPRSEPAKPPEPINFKELMDPSNEKFDPEGAFKQFVEQNYGGLLGDINKRSVQGLYTRYAGSIHDFKDYEADIEKALEGKDPASLSDRDILGTYLTLKGAKTLAKERQEMAQKAGSSTHHPSAPNEQVPDEVVLSDEMKQVAKVMFGHKEDPEGEYKAWKKKSDKGKLELTVPLDATGKRG